MKHDKLFHHPNIPDRVEYDHDAECADAHVEENIRLRTDANRFLRQRNELLEKMRLILAHVEVWSFDPNSNYKGLVGRMEQIGSIAQSAIANMEANGR